MVESDEGYIFAGALAVLFKVDGTDKKFYRKVVLVLAALNGIWREN
jgi:hypothetical protein